MRIICIYQALKVWSKKSNKNNILKIEGACHLHMHKRLFFVPNIEIDCLKMTICNSEGSFASFFNFLLFKISQGLLQRSLDKYVLSLTNSLLWI